MEEFSCCSHWTQPDGCGEKGQCTQAGETAQEFYEACAVAKRLGYRPPEIKERVVLEELNPFQ